MVKVIGIISIKGGVGKTSAVSALAAALANEFGKRVLVVDANFSSPNLGLHLGVLEPEKTIHHVLEGKHKTKEAIYDSGYGFDVIMGGLFKGRVNPFKLREKLAEVKHKYDIVLIDASPNLNEEVLSAMIAADELIVITTPDVVTLSSTLHAVKLAKEKKTPIIGLILNKVYGKKFELSLNDIENTAGVNVIAVLPHEVQVLEALSKNIPSTLHKETASTREYKKLAGMLVGENYEDNSLKGRFLRFMKSVPKQEVNRVILTEKRFL